jgi:hypothetical protein
MPGAPSIPPPKRTPGYIFGLVGVVERPCVGAFKDPERGAFREGGPRVPLYRCVCVVGGQGMLTAPGAVPAWLLFVRVWPSASHLEVRPHCSLAGARAHLQHPSPYPPPRVRFRQGDVWEGYAGGRDDTVDIEIYQVGFLGGFGG